MPQQKIEEKPGVQGTRTYKQKRQTGEYYRFYSVISVTVLWYSRFATSSEPGMTAYSGLVIVNPISALQPHNSDRDKLT